MRQVINYTPIVLFSLSESFKVSIWVQTCSLAAGGSWPPGQRGGSQPVVSGQVRWAISQTVKPQGNRQLARSNSSATLFTHVSPLFTKGLQKALPVFAPASARSLRVLASSQPGGEPEKPRDRKNAVRPHLPSLQSSILHCLVVRSHVPKAIQFL